MFEDLINIKKKKQISCKFCGSTDIEVSEKIQHTSDMYIPYTRYRQLTRCYSCCKVYYVSVYNETAVK